MATQTTTVTEPVEQAVQPTTANDGGVRADIRQFVAALLLVCVTVLLLMCLVSGRWMSNSPHNNRWQETSIWGTCACRDIKDTSNCSDRSQRVDASKAFSIIACGFEFLAVVVLLWYPKGKVARILIAAFLFLAAISHILVIAIMGNLFRNTFCGVKLKDVYHLDWAYGIRCAEFVFAVVLGIVILARPRGRRIVFLTILLLYLSVFTTTSRGWYAWHHAQPGVPFEVTDEVGLFDACTCQRTGDIQCDQVRRLFRAAEAFMIISTATAVVLTAMVVYAIKAGRAANAAVAWLLFIFLILPWIFVAAVWNQRYCGGKYKDIPGYRLEWAFGLQVALSGLFLFDAILISLMPAYKSVTVA